MSDFNFSSLSTTSGVSTSMKRLSPWGIYPVKFAGASKASFQGKKDTSMTYDVLRVRFEGEDGYYEESIFYPKPGDEKRPVYTSRDGHEYEGASSFDRTMTFIAQVGEVLNPEGFKKMQAASSKFRSFEDVVTAFIKITDVAKGKETHLKLVGRTQNGNVNACLPKFVAINKEGQRFTCDNFIGDKLFFSPYEETKMKEFQNATPTEMGSEQVNQIDTAPAGSEDLDFESLL